MNSRRIIYFTGKYLKYLFAKATYVFYSFSYKFQTLAFKELQKIDTYHAFQCSLLEHRGLL